MEEGNTRPEVGDIPAEGDILIEGAEGIPAEGAEHIPVEGVEGKQIEGIPEEDILVEGAGDMQQVGDIHQPDNLVEEVEHG